MQKNLLARVAFIICVLGPGMAHAKDWIPKLLSPEQGIRHPLDPVRVSLPKGLPMTTQKQLTVELDDFDVTAFTAFRESTLIFTPIQPLTYGQHSLRLVEHDNQGNIIERGSWVLDIRESKTYREANFASSTNISLSERIADGGLLDDSPGNLQASGAAQFNGAVSDKNWKAQGNISLITNSNETLMPRQSGHLDIAGPYIFLIDYGPVTAAIGHQTVGSDSLIMQGFNRRGVSIGYLGKKNGTAISAFSLSAKDVIGFYDGLGIGDDNNRVDGFTFSSRPFTTQTGSLLISATYITGKGDTQSGQTGSGVAAYPTNLPEGHAGSVVADGSLLDQRLRMRAEYASSQYDFDGPGGFDPEDDHAHTELITYSVLQGKVIKGLPMMLSFGIENTRIGTYFRSLANPTGISDRNSLRAMAWLTWGSFNTQGVIGRETSNVNNLDFIPRLRTNQASLIMNYTPSVQPSVQNASMQSTAWYGQPSYSISINELNQDITKSSPSLSTGVYSVQHNLSATAIFTYPEWRWSLNHKIDIYDDRTTNNFDTTSHQTEINASWSIDKLNVIPSIQWETVDYSRQFPDSNSLTSTIDLAYAFSDRLNTSINFSYKHQTYADHSDDSRTQDTAGTLSWIALVARNNAPSLTLSLVGQRHNVSDSDPYDQDSYQISTNATMSW